VVVINVGAEKETMVGEMPGKTKASTMPQILMDDMY
jgi:hypothetical protein